MLDEITRRNASKFDTFHVYENPGYNRYSFGIGQYISFADKENVLSSLVSADADFYIGFLLI